MTTYILAGGADDSYPEYGLQLGRVVRHKVAKPRILSCGFSTNDVWALAMYPHRKKVFEECFDNTQIVVRATKEKFAMQVREADVIYFHGGSTQLLTDTMKAYPEIKDEFTDKIIIGSSAGANYLAAWGFSPTLNAVHRGSGTVDVAVIVHYGSRGFDGMTFDPEYWRKPIEAVQEASGKKDVILLPEGTFVIIEQ